MKVKYIIKSCDKDGIIQITYEKSKTRIICYPDYYMVVMTFDVLNDRDTEIKCKFQKSENENISNGIFRTKNFVIHHYQA